MRSNVILWFHDMFFIITTFIVCGSIITTSNGNLMGDECDWIGSGLTSGQDRGVTPVYLRCREGTLKWLYPRGALRLIFRLPNDRQDFKVCIQSNADLPDEPDLFTSDVEHFKAEVPKVRKFPARVYLEGARGLKPLYLPDDGDIRMVRCFYSKLGKAAVYVEADEVDGLKRAVAVLRYEARPLPRNSTLDDCKPCSSEEITLAFCTSDLVAEGDIVSMRQRPEFDTSELTVQVSKLVRHTSSEGSSTSMAATLSRLRRRNAVDRKLIARIHVPKSCDAGPGPGKFLLTARRRLGRLTLACASRMEDWERIAQKYLQAPCKLLE